MEIIDPLCDYFFTPGERAQYVYFNDKGEEQTLVVNILDWRNYPEGKIYIVSAHEKALNEVGIWINTFLSEHYYAELPPGHKAAYLDPDELLPAFRQFEIVVDNTRGNNND